MNLTHNYYYFKNALSPETCDKIKELGKRSVIENAVTHGENTKLDMPGASPQGEKTLQEVKNNIIFNESFCVKDFKEQYNSYKGNAYGMANTLLQTAFLRPNLKSKKVKHLYFTGQLTVPGPGVPPALISGKLAADLIKNNKI